MTTIQMVTICCGFAFTQVEAVVLIIWWCALHKTTVKLWKAHIDVVKCMNKHLKSTKAIQEATQEALEKVKAKQDEQH